MHSSLSSSTPPFSSPLHIPRYVVLVAAVKQLCLPGTGLATWSRPCQSLGSLCLSAVLVPSKGTFLRARQRGLPGIAFPRAAGLWGLILRARQRGLPGTAFPRAAGLWGLILRARQRGLPGTAFPRAAGLRGLIHTSSRHTLVLLKELT